MSPEHQSGSVVLTPQAADGLVVRLLKQTMPFQVVSDACSRHRGPGETDSFRGGEIIYRTGDKADDVFIVVSGEVEHTLTERRGAGRAARASSAAAASSAGPPCCMPKSGCGSPRPTCVKSAEVIRINGEALMRPAEEGAGHRRRGDEPFRDDDHPRIRRPSADAALDTAGRSRDARRPIERTGPGQRTHADDVPHLALAAQSEAVPDVDRLRLVPRLLVPVCRGMEAAALSRHARHHRRWSRSGSARTRPTGCPSTRRSTTSTSCVSCGASGMAFLLATALGVPFGLFLGWSQDVPGIRVPRVRDACARFRSWPGCRSRS